MKELLDTDRLNYLVWRYLLESNMRESAARFQKEWRVQAPHRHFDFAPHVKTHALVKIVNKGLCLEDYERQFSAADQEELDVSAAADGQRGVFGPLKFQPAAKETDQEDEDDEDSEPEPAETEPTRKRQALPNGSPTNKRPRLSNGFENGAEPATNPMDSIDQTENNHAYPSPLEREQAASPPPHTQGVTRGTQVEKVYELNQETTFLRLADHVFAEDSIDAPHSSPLVLLGEWNPKDPSLLAAAGTDALARVWTVSRATAPTSDADHVHDISHPFRDLKEDDVPANATVTSMAWNWDGTYIALATQWHGSGSTRMSIWSADGNDVHHFDGVESPVVKLRWSPNNTLLLSIGPEEKGAMMTIYNPKGSSSVSYSLPDHDLDAGSLDAAWINDTDFVVCGGSLLLALQYSTAGITQLKKLETDPPGQHVFNHVEYDWRTKQLATSNEKGDIYLWDEAGSSSVINAHTTMVTALQWQPLENDPSDHERLLASGSYDSAICIWNVRNPGSKVKYTMTMDSAILALSMTPNGAFLAGATRDQILLWKLGDHAMPRAVWRRPPHPGWSSPNPNGLSEEEDFQPCLGWDADGYRLRREEDNANETIRTQPNHESSSSLTSVPFTTDDEKAPEQSAPKEAEKSSSSLSSIPSGHESHSPPHSPSADESDSNSAPQAPDLAAQYAGLIVLDDSDDEDYRPTPPRPLRRSQANRSLRDVPVTLRGSSVVAVSSDDESDDSDESEESDDGERTHTFVGEDDEEDTDADGDTSFLVNDSGLADDLYTGGDGDNTFVVSSSDEDGTDEDESDDEDVAVGRGRLRGRQPPSPSPPAPRQSLSRQPSLSSMGFARMPRLSSAPAGQTMTTTSIEESPVEADEQPIKTEEGLTDSDDDVESEANSQESGGSGRSRYQLRPRAARPASQFWGHALRPIEEESESGAEL